MLTDWVAACSSKELSTVGTVLIDSAFSATVDEFDAEDAAREVERITSCKKSASARARLNNAERLVRFETAATFAVDDRVDGD